MPAIEVDLLSDTVTRPTRAMRQFRHNAVTTSRALSSPTMCRFIPALSDNESSGQMRMNFSIWRYVGIKESELLFP
jgi:hypothetical protein